MTPERLAEFQEARRKLLAGDMPDEPVSAAFVELIDALTAERERAEKAEAQCDVLVKLLQKARKA